MSSYVVLDILKQLNWKSDIPNEPTVDLIKITYAFITRNIWNRSILSILVNQADDVFATGDNSCGQLELGHNQSIDSMVKLDSLCSKNICEFFEGNGCIFARSTDGYVYVWGWNHWAQLGIGEISDDKVYKTPQINKFLSDIKFISCGDLHYLALSKTGVVYGWGVNCEGQLSTTIKKDIISTPVKIFNDISKIIYINCFSNCSLSINSNGKIFVWGQCFLQDLDDDSFLVYEDQFVVFGSHKFDKAIVLDNAIFGLSDNKLFKYFEEKFIKVNLKEDNINDIVVDRNGNLLIQIPTNVIKFTDQIIYTGNSSLNEYFLETFRVTNGTLKIEQGIYAFL